MASRNFPVNPTAIPEILEWIREHIGETLLAPAAKGQLVLAVEEAVVNVISHAKGEGPLEVLLEVRYLPERQVEVEVRDRAEPFNPLEREVPEVGESIEESEVGGLGISLMQRCADSLLYRYEDGENVLTLIKSL